MAIQTERTMPVAEYLEWEERQELKHEFIDGEIIQTSGGTGNHSKIAMNIALALGSLVNLLSYVFHSSNMRIRINENRYVYPDLSIAGREEIYEDASELTLLNPLLVVEVSSPSSAVRDRVDKLGYYLEVPSIQAYLVVEQDRPSAHLHTRAEDRWMLQIFDSAADVIPLPMLNCELPLEQVYRGIQFEEA